MLCTAVEALGLRSKAKNKVGVRRHKGQTTKVVQARPGPTDDRR